jgi:16S rRNA (cytosine967-C5)-methyltransferase
MPEERRDRRRHEPSRQRPAERGRTADPARRAAYTVLRAVDRGAYANLELPAVLRQHRISGRDAAFATELTYGSLRLRGRYDPILAVAAERPLSAVDAGVLDTLRLGAHQVLGMRVPPHAAVAETVALARQVNGAGAAGFVNAVLRRVSRRTLAAWLDDVAPEETPIVTRLAVRESHPEWIVSALRAALIGHGLAETDDVDAQLAALLVADNERALVTLVARPGLASVAELVAAGAEPGRYAPTAAVLPGGDPGDLSAVRNGRAAVQDEGSQLVTLALAAAQVDSVAGRPQRWLDLCAGPGGKAGLLAALALAQGAELVANEPNLGRADLVRSTLRAVLAAAQPGQVQVRSVDGREVGELEPAAYDRVLVDAPCTGLGALRRRPEARWRRRPDDVPQLASLQRDLLNSALAATRPGGVVAYVTCSPHLAETRFAVLDVTRRRTDVETLDARDLFRDRDAHLVPHLGEGPFVQLWPHVHGTDAMFFALLRRLG